MKYQELAEHAPAKAWHLFVPKLLTVLRQGYGFADFRADTISGLTVAIVALPLAMALAIASGATPDKGLVTVVIAGLLVSALGGSRFQIGGPTGAFVVVVFNVIHDHGYDGLLLATLMAGLMLVAAGLARFGDWIKYIPEPVITGFTAGIAIIILSSQIRDLLGLEMAQVPADFVAKLAAFWAARESVNPWSVAVAAGALAIILSLRRLAPKAPGFLIAILVAALAVTAWGAPVETIGSRFGGIPRELPAPAWPAMSWARIVELLPSAFTIAFLAGVESLLSAVIADGMTGRRHRSNCELVAQGVANSASALFGGLPATGALARTATNIRAGARSPVSGVLHAVFVLAFMMVAAPLAAYIPLASLAAVLVIVAWNMSEIDKIRHFMGAPAGERAVMLLTLALTVLVDITVAIAVGVVLAAMMFMHRMAEAVGVQQGVPLVEHDVDDFMRAPDDVYNQRVALPPGVEVFQFRGPLFFGAASRLANILERIGGKPRAFVLRMEDVPVIDATGAGVLADLVRRCRAHGTTVIIAGLGARPRATLQRLGLGGEQPGVIYADTFAAALAKAAA